jgi:outer membrane protein TolC
MLGRNIAQGDLLAANGEFDLKLKGDTLNMPLGNYENYRQYVGAEQPLYGGGSAFGGYRLGTGNFPIYYGERATNLGGEFKAGVLLPLAQNRTIDERRAGLWRNQWEVQGVEPEIQAQLIEFIRVASITYWNWLAAGQNVQIAEDLLKNATERNDGLRIRVQKGDAPAIELTDNERLIVSRRTKLIDVQRKFRQSAVKLSLFLRDESGEPIVIDQSRLPLQFPEATDPSPSNLDTDIQSAIANRPELRALAILSEQLNIDLAAANNLFLPQIDVVLATSQDVGSPEDPKKNDKSQLEFEGGLIASVPLQRRKARGKLNAVEAKLAQVRAKTGFTQNKIVAEVQSTSAAFSAAFQQLAQAHRSLDLARQMEAAERRKFDLGDSNLLLVNLREQATADAAATEVEARLNYFDAQADYRAVLASDVVP